MNKKNLDIAYFLSFCIEQYKEAKHLSGAEAAKIFDKYGVLEYLEKHFEPLHSQSRQWILEDIDEFIGLRKGEAVWNYIRRWYYESGCNARQSLSFPSIKNQLDGRDAFGR